MAAVTPRVATADTSNVTSYATGAFTPALGDLLVFFVDATTTLATGTATASANGVTFTKVLSSVRGTTAHTQYCFIADQLTTGTASMTCTFDCTGDTATGAVTMVGSVAGMTNTGLAAIRQSTKIDNGVGGTTPAFTHGVACLTTNPTMSCLGTPAAVDTTPPTGWTLGGYNTYITPQASGHWNYRDSGFSGTTITWGSTAQAHGGISIELDASSSAVTLPILVMAPRTGA